VASAGDRDRGDIVVRLVARNRADDTEWNKIRLNTRRIMTDPAMVRAALDKD